MLNPFITEECKRAGIGLARIETSLVESYAQAGEDMILAALVAAVGVKAPPAKSLFYFEIGANHPIQTSNTYLLYKNYNGHGVLVEADPELIAPLTLVRPRDTVVHAAVTDQRTPTVKLNVSRAKELSSLDANHHKSFGEFGELANLEGQVEVPNLHVNDLLEKYATEPIFYMSVDVEGGDLAILRAIDFERFRPRLLSCEPAGHIYPNNPQDMYHTMLRNGYTFIAQTYVNMIFLDKRWI